jgi:hypothetical protein
MAGDWMKMRVNLWDDPRVSSLVDATDTSEAAVIGGLYWLWATADQHSADGHLPGLTLRQLDRKTGLAGFGAALVAIGWVAEEDGGLLICRFNEHNGTGAKKRMLTARRVAEHKASRACGNPGDMGSDDIGAGDGNASETQDDAAGNATSVTKSVPERDLEKRREDKSSTPDRSLRAERSLRARAQTAGSDDGEPAGPGLPPAAPQPSAPLDPTAAGRACLAMRRGGLAQTNPGDPRLAAAIAEGATDAMWQATAAEACGHDPPKGVAWVIATVRGRIADAACQPNTTGVTHGAHRSQPRLSAVDRVVANIQRARQLDQQRGNDGGDDAIPGEAVRIPR